MLTNIKLKKRKPAEYLTLAERIGGVVRAIEASEEAITVYGRY